MLNLLDIDWHEAWRERDIKRLAYNGSEYWNGRAGEFAQKSGKSGYSRTFLEYLDLQPGKSVLDMGCGSGALTVPLARAGHQVIAADFSDNMLEAVTTVALSEGLTNILRKKLDWDEDWVVAGIKPKSVDVAIASRSMIVRNLGDAIEKLSSTARDKVCVTMATGRGPRAATEILEYIGRTPEFIPDHSYGFNLLLQMGYNAELRYIDSFKSDRFPSREEALGYFRTMIGDLTAAEDRLLQHYLDEHIIEYSGDLPFGLDRERLIRWAFLTWEPR